MLRILIYHESPTASQSISHVLQGEPDFEVVGQSDSLEDVLRHLQRSRCDMLLVSCSIPRATTQHLIQSAQALPFSCKIMVIGLPQDEEAILACLEDGVDGYVCQCEGVAELVKKIRYLADEEFIIEPTISASLIARISSLKQLVNELNGGNIARPHESYAELTQRELEVLRLLGEEYSNQQIAEQLTIELGTVKNHVHNLLRKLDVCSRKQAAQLAQQLFGNMGANSTLNYHPTTPAQAPIGSSTRSAGWLNPRLA